MDTDIKLSEWSDDKPPVTVSLCGDWSGDWKADAWKQILVLTKSEQFIKAGKEYKRRQKELRRKYFLPETGNQRMLR